MSSSAPRSPEDQLELALASLEHGSKSRKSGFHHAVLATSGEYGPSARTLILRAVEREPFSIRFHCDRRSTKIEAIAKDPRAEACFYSPADRMQIRATGELALLTQGPLVDQAWQETQLLSRRCYLVNQGPGSALIDPDLGMPDHLKGGEPSQEESEEGRKNFAVLLLKATKLDVMELHISGHIRSCHLLEPNGWNSFWTQP